MFSMVDFFLGYLFGFGCCVLLCRWAIRKHRDEAKWQAESDRAWLKTFLPEKKEVE